MCHSWALRIVVGPYSSQLGSMLRRLTLLIAVAPYALWLGSTHCHWALLVAIGLGMSSWGPLPCRLPLCLIVRRCWAGHVIMGPSAMSFATPPHCTQVLGSSCRRDGQTAWA